MLIQASQYFDIDETKERELRALVAASREGFHIEVIPLYEWLLKV